jgi:hypothetical protein
MINVRENNSGQEWTIQRHWQQWTHKTQDDDKQNKYIHNTKQKSKEKSTTDPKKIVKT